VRAKRVEPALASRAGFALLARSSQPWFHALMSGFAELPIVLQGWDHAPRFFDFGRLDLRHNDARFLAAFGDDFAPWRDHQRMPVGAAAFRMLPALGWCEDIAAGLDCSRAQQHMPVRTAGGDSEGGRHRKEARASLRQGPV